MSKSDINRLKDITSASPKDLLEGQNLLWIMRRIILNQEARINQLELKLAKLCGEIEPDVESDDEQQEEQKSVMRNDH